MCAGSRESIICLLYVQNIALCISSVWDSMRKCVCVRGMCA